MRLVCPNCEAKYEVPDDAIPDSGRDVQCANCGHAWFQTRSRAVSAITPLTEAVETPAAVAAAPEPEVTSDVTAEAPAPVAETVAADPRKTDTVETVEPPAPATEAETPNDEATAKAIDAAPALPEPEEELAAEVAAPAVDEKVLSILREEAEREEEARRVEVRKTGAMQAEADSQMQVQPDLGVDAAGVTGALTATQRRLAMLKGEDPDAPPPEPPRPAARRDLLPDVEEINSTLQPGEGGDPDAEIDALPDLTRGRSSFRSGFFLVFLLFIVAAVVYVAAQRLAAQFPALEGALNGYVAFVDGLRLWLNDLMKSATQAISGGEA